MVLYINIVDVRKCFQIYVARIRGRMLGGKKPRRNDVDIVIKQLQNGVEGRRSYTYPPQHRPFSQLICVQS